MLVLDRSGKRMVREFFVAREVRVPVLIYCIVESKR
jgi:hypothetical protein